MAIGPLARWKQLDARDMARRLRLAGVAGRGRPALGLPLLMGGWSALVALGLLLAVWIAASTVLQSRERLKAGASAAVVLGHARWRTSASRSSWSASRWSRATRSRRTCAWSRATSPRRRPRLPLLGVRKVAGPNYRAARRLRDEPGQPRDPAASTLVVAVSSRAIPASSPSLRERDRAETAPVGRRHEGQHEGEHDERRLDDQPGSPRGAGGPGSRGPRRRDGSIATRAAWASRGSATTSRTKRTRPTSLACAGSRWTRELPSTCRCGPCPEPTSVVVAARRGGAAGASARRRPRRRRRHRRRRRAHRTAGRRRRPAVP